jgi:putative toxin-antitoxin system antitoxin component (TIGR02293 family)
MMCHIVPMANKLAHKSFSTHLQAVKRDAATGQFIMLSPKDIKTTWAARFAGDELDVLVIPKRTLARRNANHEELSPEETDKALRLARIATEADRVFANIKKADLWLRTPLQRLSGQTPLALLKSEAGALLVEEILGQIDHGMFA